MNEQDCLEQLRREGYEVTVWEDPPHASYGNHTHAGDEVRWVVRGTMTLGIPGGETHELGPGDRLDVPAGTVHWARVGPEGVRYVCGSR